VAVIQLEQPLTQPAGTQLKIAWRVTDMPGCMRFSITRAAAPAAPAVNHAALLAIQIPAAERTEQHQAAIFTAWRTTVADAKAINDEIEASWKEYPQAETSILHLVEREPANHRPTHRLDRGNGIHGCYRAAHAGGISPSGHARAIAWDLPAGWLIRSPFTARVAVNCTGRRWHGLVETPRFRYRGRSPSTELLTGWRSIFRARLTQDRSA
jgi:hypothetical protein